MNSRKFKATLSYLKRLIINLLTQKKTVILKLLTIIFLFILASIIVPKIEIFKIQKITITDIENQHSITNDFVIKQAKDFLNQKSYSYWNINLTRLENYLKNSSPLIKDVVCTKVFPNTVQIKVTEYNILLKHEDYNDCELFSLANIIKTDKDICTQYEIPIIDADKGLNLEQNITCPLLFQKYLLTYDPNNLPIEYLIIKREGTKYVTIKFRKYTVLIDPYKDVESTFKIYYNLYKGLNKQNIKYSKIDLRFDKIIIK